MECSWTATVLQFQRPQDLLSQEAALIYLIQSRTLDDCIWSSHLKMMTHHYFHRALLHFISSLETYIQSSYSKFVYCLISFSWILKSVSMPVYMHACVCVCVYRALLLFIQECTLPLRSSHWDKKEKKTNIFGPPNVIWKNTACCLKDKRSCFWLLYPKTSLSRSITVYGILFNCRENIF